MFLILNFRIFRKTISDPAAFNANIVADWHGKRIEQVARFPVQIFEHRPETMKRQPDQIGKSVQAAIQTRTRKHSSNARTL